MNNKVFLHIGLHKTATTTLQTQFFHHIKDINYYWNNNESTRVMIDLIAKNDPMYFNASATVARLGAIENNNPILISEESLSGPPFSGEREWGLDNRSNVISNMLAAFPSASVILVLRRQDKFAASIYRQYLKFGGTQPIDRFFGVDTEPDYFGLFSQNKLNFLNYARAIKASFGNRILLLAFEEFIKTPETFLSKICAFMGRETPNIALVRSNETRLGATGLNIARALNHLFASKHNPGGLLRGIPIIRNKSLVLKNPMPFLHDNWPYKGKTPNNSNLHTIPKLLLDREKERNRELDKEFNLELKNHGYY